MASMQAAMLEQLKAIPLFQAVEADGLSELAARVVRRRVDAGQLVFREGAPADAFYVVLSGSVKIFIHDATGKEVVLDTKTAGDFFGEMMLDHRPRSASIVTLEPCEFAVIERRDFSAFIAAHPQAAERLILHLVQRTRGMNVRLKQYAERLGEAKPLDALTVRRWLVAKRWLLAGLLVLAAAQFYYIDVVLQILSLPGLTVFPGR